MGGHGGALPTLEITLPLEDFTDDNDTLTSLNLLMDAQSIYEISVSRCLVFVMLSIAALGIDRPQRRSMTTTRQANLVHLTFEKRRTAALDLTEFLRFFA